MHRLAASLLTCLIVFGAADRALGQVTMEWTNPDGGWFFDADNWVPYGVPGSEDTAVFPIIVSGPIDWLVGPWATARAIVSYGSYTFDFAGYEWELRGQWDTDFIPTLLVDGRFMEIPFDADLTLTNGSVLISHDGGPGFSRVGTETSANNSLTIGAGATLHLRPALGLAVLILDASSTGSASVIVEDGGHLIDGGCASHIGLSPTAGYAELIVRGEGSRYAGYYDECHWLHVGPCADALVRAEAGGDIELPWGMTIGSGGRAEVDGAGSTLVILAEDSWHEYGLEIETGASVSIQNGGQMSAPLGVLQEVGASVTVNGSGSVLGLTGLQLHGSLTVSGGGRVNLYGYGYGNRLYPTAVVTCDTLSIGQESSSGLVLDSGSRTMTAEAGCNIDVTGDYIQAAGGALEIEHYAGEVGMVEAVGVADLGGALTLSLADGFDPPVGATFDVITAADVTQPYDVTLMPGLPGGKFFRVEYSGRSGREGGVTLIVEDLESFFEFDPLIPEGLTGIPSGVALGDFDGARGIDLAVTIPDDNPGSDGSVLVLFNAGTDSSGDWLGFSGSTQVMVGVDPTDLMVGHLDDDGLLDIAVSNENGANGTISVLLNDGAGSFVLDQTIPVGGSPTAIAGGDFDADRLDDLLVSIVNNGGPDTVLVLRNTGDRGFEVLLELVTDAGPGVLEPEDLDEDEDLDFGFACAGEGEDDGTVWLLLNDGRGFGEPIVIQVGRRPGAMAMADFTQNGFVDIVVTNHDDATVSVITNAGAGQFQLAANLPVGDHPRSVAALDLEPDGDVDIALLAEDGQGQVVVQVLRTDQTGPDPLVFAAAETLEVGDNPLLLVVGDVDGNDVDDLIVLDETFVTDGRVGQGSANIRLNSRVTSLYVGPGESIQAAIDAADQHIRTISVAPGTYNEIITFNGKAVALRSTDGPLVTTIDGSGWENSVVRCVQGEGPDTVLDGFTIAHADSGGGLYNYPGSPTVTNCIFAFNNKLTNGAGICNAQYSSPFVRDCVFLGNTAGQGGGGMLNYLYCNPTLVNCLFVGNQGDLGGGMRNYQSYPVIINCTFVGNQAQTGGAMYNEQGAEPLILNGILWNDAAGATPEIVNSMAGALIGTSDIEGCGGSGAGWNGSFGADLGGNVDADPLFVDADGPDETYGTLDDNARLRPGSPCIDAGDNTAVPQGITTDLDGNPRFHDDPGTEDTGIGDPPIVDMGAYEFQVDSCPADFDGDGDVDTADLLFLLGAWGTPDGDVDGDNDTDTADLLALLAAWGQCP